MHQDFSPLPQMLHNLDNQGDILGISGHNALTSSTHMTGELI